MFFLCVRDFAAGIGSLPRRECPFHGTKEEICCAKVQFSDATIGNYIRFVQCVRLVLL